MGDLFMRSCCRSHNQRKGYHNPLKPHTRKTLPVQTQFSLVKNPFLSSLQREITAEGDHCRGRSLQREITAEGDHCRGRSLREITAEGDHCRGRSCVYLFL